MIGQVIGGKYRVLELLGQGGMGSVFAADQIGLDRQVAIKILRADLKTAPSVVHRFESEGRFAASIHDPNIVQVFDVGVLADGRAYLVMELLVGESLEAFMRTRGKLGVAEAVAIAKQIASGLGSAHEKGIIHRDLKPSNVYLAEAKRAPLGVTVKLLDFGIAKTMDDAGRDAPTTATGSLLGTPYYMSPEQIRGLRNIDARTDVYALGGILFEMVCGRRAFEAESQFELVNAQVHNPPPDPRTIEPSVPKALARLIVQMLAKDAGERPGNIEKVRSELAAIELPEARIELRPRAVKNDVGLEPGAPVPKSPAPSITMVAEKVAPSSLFGSTLGGTPIYFKTDDLRFDEIKNTFSFYRAHLTEEYSELTRQMKTAHTMWLVCVGLGFAMLLVGLGVLLFADRTKTTAGIVTSLSSALVYFIVRTLQKREDRYRDLRTEKNKTLEYGNDWLLLIQSIDAIRDPNAKMEHQARLVAVLTEKLEHARATLKAVPLRSSPKKRAAGAQSETARADP
jgi:serine/threonine protein kinase